MGMLLHFHGKIVDLLSPKSGSMMLFARLNILSFEMQSTRYLDRYLPKFNSIHIANTNLLSAEGNVICLSTLTINQVAGLVAPVTKTFTYGVVKTGIGCKAQCRITQKLGANHQVTSATDNKESSAGRYWQFNRKQVTKAHCVKWEDINLSVRAV
jgi:hypothetical protein